MQLCILPKSYSVLFNLSTNFQFFAASVITSLWGSFAIIRSQLYSGKMQQNNHGFRESILWHQSSPSWQPAYEGRIEQHGAAVHLFTGGRPRQMFRERDTQEIK